MALGDYKSLSNMFKGKGMGVQTDYTTKEDVEAYKYNYFSE